MCEGTVTRVQDFSCLFVLHSSFENEAFPLLAILENAVR